MNEKFYELTKEKQDRMINGAMKVFAINGYQRASTDEMVKTTGVSKGLWFHYFDNKIGLYYFVCSYAVRYAVLELSMKDGGVNRSYFDCKLMIEQTKVSLTDRYPYLPLLLKAMENEKNDEALEVIGEVRSKYFDMVSEKLQRTYEVTFGSEKWAKSLDFMIEATFEKLLHEEYSQQLFSGERYLNEVEKYLAIVQNLAGRSEI